MVCFVDDVPWEGDTKFSEIADKLKQTFHIEAEHKQISDYICMRLEQNHDFSINIHHREYIDSINEIKLDTKFHRGNNQLNTRRSNVVKKSYWKNKLDSRYINT